MKKYELILLVVLELTEEEASLLWENITSYIKERGEVLIGPSSLIKTELGHEIKKKSRANMGTLIFNLNPKDLDGLRALLKEEDSILRYMLYYKKDLPEAKPARLGRRKVEKKPDSQSQKVDIGEIDKKIEEILSE